MNIQDSAEHLVQRQAQEKLAAINDLVEGHKRLESAREELAESEAVYKAAHAAALNSGWTNAELRKVGLRALPATQKRRRRTTPKKSTDDAAQAPQHGDSSTPPATEAISPGDDGRAISHE